MTTRAILWCGALTHPRAQWTKEGVLRPDEEDDDRTYDRAAQANGLKLAFRAAQALGAVPGDIHACVCDDLLPDEFATRRRPATQDELDHLTRSLARDATDNDRLLFVATNHGGRSGLVAETLPDPLADDGTPPAYLTPTALGGCLGRLPSQQAVVIVACYAGQFLSLGGPSRVVLAACGADETYWIRKDPEGACSAFLSELFAAWCGVVLPSSSGIIPTSRLPVSQAFECARQRLAAADSPNLPLTTGSVTW